MAVQVQKRSRVRGECVIMIVVPIKAEVIMIKVIVIEIKIRVVMIIIVMTEQQCDKKQTNRNNSNNGNSSYENKCQRKAKYNKVTSSFLSFPRLLFSFSLPSSLYFLLFLLPLVYFLDLQFQSEIAHNANKLALFIIYFCCLFLECKTQLGKSLVEDHVVSFCNFQQIQYLFNLYSLLVCCQKFIL